MLSARIRGTLAKSKSSSQGLAAHASEAEGYAAEVADVQAAGITLEEGPHMVYDSEQAAMTHSEVAFLRLLGALEALLPRGASGSRANPPGGGGWGRGRVGSARPHWFPPQIGLLACIGACTTSHRPKLDTGRPLADIPW